MIQMSPVKYVVLHHTGVVSTRLSEEAHLRSIQRTTEERYGGRFPFPYHYIIGSSGTQYEGQSEGLVCPHCGVDQGEGPIHNSNSLGVSCMGNFEQEEMSQAQFHSLVTLLCDLQSKYPNLQNQTKNEEYDWQKIFVPHKQIVCTDCPGRNFPYQKLLSSIAQTIQPLHASTGDHPVETPWFQKAVDFCLNNGIMTGDEYGFRPQECVTRGELASVLYRLLRGDQHL